jgi:long-chain acyl-CoA synthetase
MRGYWNKPDDTRAVITADGWFKTGDIGSIDADGYLTITDRKKELWKTSGGKYIAPAPIEQLIKSSRFVSQVVVIGNGRKFPAALIVPDWEQLESYAKLKGLTLRTHAEFCRDSRIIDLFERQIAARTETLAQFEKIKRIALLPHELTMEGGELTPTLKVKRRIVDEKYRDVIDRIYAGTD